MYNKERPSQKDEGIFFLYHVGQESSMKKMGSFLKARESVSLADLMSDFGKRTISSNNIED
jgi:hypothetical protein